MIVPDYSPALTDSRKPGAAAPRHVNEAMAARLLRLIDRRAGPTAALLKKVGSTLDLEEFLREGLPALSDHELRKLSAAASVALGDLHSQITGRAPFRECDWRLLLFCLVNSRRLGEAIACAADLFEAVDGRMGTLELIRNDATAHVVMSGVRGDDQELAFAVALNAMVLFHEMFGWLVAQPLGGDCHLEFDASCRTLVDEAVLPFRLLLEAPLPGFSFDVRYLDLPTVRSIEDSKRHMLNSLFSYTEDGEPRSVADEARRLIRTTLRGEGRLPSLDRLAQTMNVGRMTLRRRLAAADTSFQALRDTVRRDFALELIERTDHPIEEIAVRLDFCDSDAFRIAFRRWTGMAPTDHRRRSRTSARPA